MMKKYVNKVLAVAMAVSMMVPVSVMAAENISNTATGTSDDSTECQTNIKYNVSETYTWQVPADVTFTSDTLTQTNTAENGVKITKNVIKSGQKLSIKIKEGQAFSISANATGKTDATLKYEVFKGSDTTGTALKAGEEVLSAKAGTNTASTAMAYKLTTASGENVSEVAGEYTGTLSYTSSIIAQ